MPAKLTSLRKSAEFINVYNGKQSAANKFLVLYVLKNKKNENRFGITVSRKVGKAVIRNKVRRRIREILRSYLFAQEKTDRLQKNGVYFDMVVIARHNAAEATYLELCAGLEKLIDKLMRRL